MAFPSGFFFLQRVCFLLPACCAARYLRKPSSMRGREHCRSPILQ